MAQIGKLFFIGLSGAGKSTLVKHVLSSRTDIDYIKTYTTRKPRSEEESKQSLEYSFVDFDEYVGLRSGKSTTWDHSEYAGNCYGVDLNDIHTKVILEGRNMILNVVPDASEVKRMIALYPRQPIGIFIDTPKEVASLRMSLERPVMELKRTEMEKSVESLQFEKELSFLIFKPEGILEKDKETFLQLINEIITS